MNMSGIHALGNSRDGSKVTTKQRFGPAKLNFPQVGRRVYKSVACKTPILRFISSLPSCHVYISSLYCLFLDG